MRILLGLAIMLMSLAPASAESGVSDARFARLARGVNLSHWYAQSQHGYGEDHLSTYLTREDAALIDQMGFTHVRLTLDLSVPFDLEKGGELRPDRVGKLVERIGWFTHLGLAVIVDLHPVGEHKKPLLDRAGADAFVAGWGNLAKRLSSLDPELVFFEVLNEPEPLNGEAWRELQGRALATIREAAPEHTVIVNPGGWSGMSDLAVFQPYDDKNVVYTVHWYGPHLYTHQAATWAWNIAERVRGLDWPIAPADAGATADRVTDDAEARGHVRWQIEQGEFTADWLAKQFGVATRWQAEHGNPRVYVGEFGVYRKDAPPEGRLRWHEACRREFERRGWGWAMWDYAGGFAVVNKADGKRVPDEAMLEALGLRQRD